MSKTSPSPFITYITPGPDDIWVSPNEPKPKTPVTFVHKNSCMAPDERPAVWETLKLGEVECQLIGMRCVVCSRPMRSNLPAIFNFGRRALLEYLKYGQAPLGMCKIATEILGNSKEDMAVMMGVARATMTLWDASGDYPKIALVLMEAICEGRYGAGSQDGPKPDFKAIRKAIGISNGEMAKLLQTSTATVSRLEHGRGKPTLSQRHFAATWQKDPEKTLASLKRQPQPLPKTIKLRYTLPRVNHPEDNPPDVSFE